MKAARRVALYFLGLALILLAGGAPLLGEENSLAKVGVIRLDNKFEAPEFTLLDLNGTKRTLSDFQGRYIMLNFWATW